MKKVIYVVLSVATILWGCQNDSIPVDTEENSIGVLRRVSITYPDVLADFEDSVTQQQIYNNLNVSDFISENASSFGTVLVFNSEEDVALWSNKILWCCAAKSAD